MSVIPATAVPRRVARPVVSGVPGPKLVPAPASARDFFGVVIVCALFLVDALGIAFALNTQMVDTAYEIQSVQKELNVTATKEATLANRVVSASTPQKLTTKVEQLGLVPATSALHLDLMTEAVKRPPEPQRKQMSFFATDNESEGRGASRPRRAVFSRYICRLKEYHSLLPLAARRLHSLAIAPIVCALVLGIRSTDLQGVRSASLAQAASGLRMRVYTLHTKQGDIVDSKSSMLAISIERYNIGADQKAIAQYKCYDKDGNPIGSDATATTERLVPLLKMDRAELGSLLPGGEKRKSFAYVEKDVSPGLWCEVNALRITGIEPEQYMKREYPSGTVVGNVLGYTGQVENEPAQVEGQAGIEKSQEVAPAGKNGSFTVEVVKGGVVLPNSKREEAAVEDGSTVKPVTDRDLQSQLMKAVDDSIRANNVEWEAAVVVEIGTGGIPAFVDSSSPNPADPGSTMSSDWRLRAVRASVEPGSTGKLVTFSDLIDQKKVMPESVSTVPYSITMPNGEKVHDNDSHGTERMTVTEIPTKPYNTGLIQIDDKVTDAKRYDYTKKFDIGSKTGIEPPMESRGRLTQPSLWGPRGRYTTMFDQGWLATTVQLGQMVTTIGSRGVRVPMYIVESVVDADGNEKPVAPEKRERVISADSAATMPEMVQAVTGKDSTGYLARVERHGVMGKTGTAQVPDANGKFTKRVGTFVGVPPADKPWIIVTITVFNGKGAGYGGKVAALVFPNVAYFAIWQLRTVPSTEPLFRYPWYEYQIGKND